jgi:hypothetical protein
MTAITDAIAMINLFAGKTLSNAELLEVVNLVIASQGQRFTNPWDEIANPAEYAAWPTNEEKAAFFIEVGERYYRSLLYKAGLAASEASAAATNIAAAQAAANKI